MASTLALSRKNTYGSRAAKKRASNIKLVDIMLAIMAIEFIAGGIIIAREIIEARKVREQISQISKFNAAVSVFYDKYDGMPGDLLSAQAERMGLPSGDGTPAHSDGDGKISPCTLGWQENLGCETGLFWAQLSSTELIPGTFTANIRYADSRVLETELLQYYLPKSPLSDTMYITVWNSDRSQMSPGSKLPYGNYFEITTLKGVEESKVIDEPHSLSPLMTQEIDKKIDDGYPFSGKVMVNGKADWPNDSWGSFAETGPLECVTSDEVYNTREYFKAHRALCHIAIALECCGSNR